MPLTEMKGLVSRKKTESMYADRIDRLYNPFVGVEKAQRVKSPHVEEVTRKPIPIIDCDEFISLLKNQVFTEEKDITIELDSLLPELGMDSLSLIQFRNLIFKKYGTMLSADEIFQLQTPRNIINRLQTIQVGPRDALAEIRERIDGDVQFLSKKMVQDYTNRATPTLKHEYIFLTGATGMLGAYVINELLKLEEVKRIYCLCRGDSISHAASRLVNNMKQYKLWNAETMSHKIQVLLGDIAKERMGIEYSIYSELVETVE